MQRHGLKLLVLIVMIGIFGCQKNDPVLEPSDAGRHFQASLRNGDTVSAMTQLLMDAVSYSGTVIDGESLMSVLDPEWDERFNLNDSVILVPCTSLQRFIPFSWAYLYYTMDSTMRVYYYEFVPDRDFAFSFETTEEFVEDFTGWGAVYAIGEGIVDASHYELGVIDMIYVDESLSAAQVRGGDNNWWNTRWDEWSPMFTDGVGEVGEDGPYQYPVICPTCKRNGRGSCPKKHCPHCDPKAINLDPSEIDLNELGNGIRPPIFSFNPGNNSGGIYNSGGSSSSANGIFSNIPSDFIDNWKQLDRECRSNIDTIQAIVGALSPEAWECLGQSCGVQEGANGAESGGTSNSMTDDVLDVLLHELDGATLVDPCNPNKPHQALMSELIESLCGGEYMGREDVLEALVSKDDIILTNSFVSNSVANCIYKRLLNTGLSNQTNLFCATFGSFLDSPDFDVYLMVGFPNAKARTYNNWPVNLPPTKSISIVIDQNYLSEEKDILIAKTIMHESIHAELYRVIAGIGGYSNLSPDNYPVIWEAYRDYKDWTHQVMAELYIGLLAEFLWEFDNKKFSLAHYQALAWEGLDGPADGHPVNTVWQSKSQAQKNAIQALRMALIDASDKTCN